MESVVLIGIIMICVYVICVQYEALKIRERDKNKYNQNTRNHD